MIKFRQSISSVTRVDTYTGVIVLISSTFPSMTESGLGNDVRVSWLFVGCLYTRRIDVSDTASLQESLASAWIALKDNHGPTYACGVRAISLIAFRSFARDFPIDINIWIGSDVTGASTTVGCKRIVMRRHVSG